MKEEVEQLLKKLAPDYEELRVLADGTVIGVRKFIFTTGLCVGLDETGYRGRYCFEHFIDARDACRAWDGTGDPQGPWIKWKGTGGDRRGPGCPPEPELGTPISELSGRPGHPGFDKFSSIANSWGYD